MKPIKRLLFFITILALVAIPVSFAPAPAAADPIYTCLPTCDAGDGRFLSVAGRGLSTMDDQEIRIEFAAPSDATAIEIGIFDGENGGRWDNGTGNLEFTLFADPTSIGAETTLIGTWLGEVMLDNDWFTFSIPTGPEALSPSGNYIYSMRIRNPDPSPQFWSNFKVRTDNVASIAAQDFSFAVPLFSEADVYAIYPNYPDLIPTTYNGRFYFQIYAMNSMEHFVVWDGDLDRGSYDLTDQDTDDPDTPNAFLPPWAGASAVREGVAFGQNGTTGAPSDDSEFPVNRRSPAVIFDVAPLNVPTFNNTNPSGNLEWEQYRIETDRSVPADEYVDDRLTNGLYHIHLRGMDLSNLNAWRFQYPVVGVCEADPETGEVNPCKDPLHPYLIGDMVFFDDNLNGVQDDGEAGVPGVDVCLFDGHGFPILDIANNPICTVTDETGWYSFEVEGRTLDPETEEVVEEGVYNVRINDENFDPGAPLEGYTSTTGGEEQTDTVIDENVLEYDFVYAIPATTGSIGDSVWKDRNKNHIYDPNERGIAFVTVALSGDTNGDGQPDLTATTRTDISGHYLFTDLPAGNYTVRVVAPAFVLALLPTYDYDGVDTPNVASLTLGPGESNLDVDFGYWIVQPPKPRPGTIGGMGLRIRMDR